MTKPPLQAKAGVDDEGSRLDAFLATCPGVRSRNVAQKLIADTLVTVNGSACTKKQILVLGDLVEYRAPAEETAIVEPQELPLDIVYEDDAVIVVDKAAGMVVHPGAANYTGTLVNALLAHTTLAPPGAPLRPGIVHRLDKGTSGLLVAAKTETAYFSLVDQLKARRVSREYLALVEGGFDDETGRVEAPIRRSPHDRRMMDVGGQGAKEAFTNFRVLGSSAGLSILAVTLETGRTHQIRVHMRFIQHPIIGDDVYGRAGSGEAIGVDRPWLHARRLSFAHPEDGREMTFVAPLPTDLCESLCSPGLEPLRSAAERFDADAG